MIKDTGIKLYEKDRLDINLAIHIILEANKCLAEVDNLESLTEEQARSYFLGCCDALVEGRTLLHSLRKQFSEKYNIPYNFISEDGKIFIEE